MEADTMRSQAQIAVDLLTSLMGMVAEHVPVDNEGAFVPSSDVDIEAIDVLFTLGYAVVNNEGKVALSWDKLTAAQDKDKVI